MLIYRINKHGSSEKIIQTTKWKTNRFVLIGCLRIVNHRIERINPHRWCNG
jgi:hypothetical protein